MTAARFGRSTLRFDPSTRVLAGGTIVLGGHPPRLLRLTAAGGRTVSGWRAGAAVGDSPGERGLAARLIRAELAHPVPDPGGGFTAADVAVVIPARDRAGLLRECLKHIGPAADLVVVDDGSRDRAAIAGAALAAGARVVRRESSAGPAGARNAGLRATRAPLVAFLDSDARPRDGWLEPLLAHFGDQRVAAVAPRIRSPAGSSALAAYEAVRSPLDLGPDPGIAAPGRRIGFLPATALVVRRAAVPDGFDATMRYGEDVDLVWRLAAAGWTVRYEPRACVEHPHRADFRAWLVQRLRYGSSAGPLAERHPGKLHHLVAPAWALPAWGLALAGRPRAALVAAGAGTGLLAARLSPIPVSRAERGRLVAGAQLGAARGLLDAGWRAYSPPLVLAAALGSRRARRLALGALTISTAADWLGHRPRLDPLRFGALRAADDLAYATGVWLGCMRSRRPGPLIPRLIVSSSSRRTGRR